MENYIPVVSQGIKDQKEMLMRCGARRLVESINISTNQLSGFSALNSNKINYFGL